MWGKSAISRSCAALLLVSSGTAHAGREAEVHGVAVVDEGGQTRVLIDVAAGTRYDVFPLAHPDRLVVDLHGSQPADDFHVPGPNGVVANVRAGTPVPGDMRLVFDLAAKVRPKSYFQQGDGGARLVVEMQFAHPATASRLSRNGQGAASAAIPASSSPPAGVRPGQAADASDASASATTLRTMAAEQPPAPSAAPEVSLPDTGRAPQPDLASPKRNDAAIAESRRGELKPVAPEVSPAAAVDQDGGRNAPPAEDDTPRIASHPGARTLRDVLGNGLRKIVIAVDAGHGGQDVGAKGYSGTYEKNVTLATARELARQINAEPGMKAVLTRDGDYFVPLAERYHKAREAKADLFISVHCDAEPGHDATGSSVWVLSERGVTSQAARWLADRENAADLVGGVKLSDKDDTLASVLLDLSQSATMKASEDAAERVHQALRDIGRTHKAHPERANFVVLRSPDVPSMLVETAFITNQDEEQRLNDPAYRSRLASAVLSGVRSYFVATPLPGTEFAALHARGSRDARMAAARPVHAAAPDDGDAPQRPAAAAPVMLAVADAGEQIHVVQRGEHLRDIASQYGVSLMRLRELNDLQGNQIRPGQQLRIPARGNNNG